MGVSGVGAQPVAGPDLMAIMLAARPAVAQNAQRAADTVSAGSVVDPQGHVDTYA